MSLFGDERYDDADDQPIAAGTSHRFDCDARRSRGDVGRITSEHKPHSVQDAPTRMELIAERLVMAPQQPNGIAWYSAYLLDVKYLIEQLETERDAKEQARRSHAAAEREIRRLREQLSGRGATAVPSGSDHGRASKPRPEASSPASEPEEPRLRAAVLYLTDSNQESGSK